MADSATTLMYAVRLRVIGKYVGQLSLMVALLSLVPLAASLYFQEFDITLRYLTVIVILLLIAAPAFFISLPSNINSNEALVVVALMFVLSPLLMAYPMTGAGISLSDALFEAVSAITTTGLSTLATVEDKPETFLFARAWMQWYGGLGIVVLSVGLLMGHHAAVRRLTETTSGEDFDTTARLYARRMLAVYAVLTIAGVIVLWLQMGDGFAALTHALSAVSTGGFASHDTSLAAFPWPVRFTVIGLSLCGALPLALFFFVYRRQWRHLISDLELRSLLGACLILFMLLGVLFYAVNAMTLGDAARHALLLGVSAQTTTGFSAYPVAELDNSSKLLMILSMALGGGVGSTAGGLKLLRFIILLRLIQLLLQHHAMPRHAVSHARFAGHTLEPEAVQQIVLLFVLLVMVIALSWLVFLLYGYAPLDALFEVVSATATVGLSTGIAHAGLEPLLKAVLCIDMLLGRVEILAFLILFYPRTWIGKRMQG